MGEFDQGGALVGPDLEALLWSPYVPQHDPAAEMMFGFARLFDA